MFTRSLINWKYHLPNTISEYQTYEGMDLTTVVEVLHWSESSQGEKAGITIRREDQGYLVDHQMSSQLLGHHLIIDDVVYDFKDPIKVVSHYVIGMFLAYLLDQTPTTTIHSGRCERFIAKGDCIALRLYFITPEEIAFLTTFDSDVHLRYLKYYDFVFYNDGRSSRYKVFNGGSSIKIDRHSSFIQETDGEQRSPWDELSPSDDDDR
jgi:hypothetical protein